MTVGVLVQTIIFSIGVPLGSIAGYIGGRVDSAVMRVVDVMSAFPGLLFIILIMSWLGSGLFNIFIAIGVTGWVGVCRLLRGQILSLKEKEFVRAARAMGGSHARIILTHILPNSLTPLIVALALGIPSAIFAEAGLSFIGIGISPKCQLYSILLASCYLPRYYDCPDYARISTDGRWPARCPRS